MIIEFFAAIGLAYDLKKPSLEMIKSRARRDGDQTSGVNTTFFGIIFDWVVGIFFVTFAANSAIFARFLYNGGLYNN